MDRLADEAQNVQVKQWLLHSGRGFVQDRCRMLGMSEEGSDSRIWERTWRPIRLQKTTGNEGCGCEGSHGQKIINEIRLRELSPPPDRILSIVPTLSN